MAFNAEKYMGVIVEQIADNFTELYKAVRIVPELEEIETEQIKATETNPNSLATRELETKVSLYKQSISDLVVNYDAYRTIEPLSVGLFGEWGSGKTHLLKLIENQIIDTQKLENNPFNQTVIPVFFNAWRFEKEEHLIIPLFQTLLATIEMYDSEHLGEMAKKQLGRTKERLKILSFALAKGFKIPKNIKSTVASLLAGDMTVVADFIDIEKAIHAVQEGESEAFVNKKSLEALLKSDRIESIYMNIPKWIEKITISDNINFVFLIDDLDRCLPENTLKMLESIKLFLDVPACAFVLAIDDDVVERGVAYHYRDYLQDKNNNIIINLDKEEVQNQEDKVAELPITGHEYLEKMIQLPFRIPVISEDNMYGFLEERYRSSFEKILKDKWEEKVTIPRESKESEGSTPQQSQTDMILEFFSKTIPPKPRKIKRTAMLFETKVNLLTSLDIELRPKLIAKMTLLELFAPRLLRFMQNNGYARIYERLVQFKSFDKPHSNNEEKLTLADVTEIREHINSETSSYNTKEKEIFHKLMDIVTESRGSRMVFDLDAIFDTTETPENLQLNIELMKPLDKKSLKTERTFTYLSESSLEKLFRPNDAASWADAFRDNKALANGEALLSDAELAEIIKQAKEKEEFAKDPEWMGIVATYIDDRQYKKLLKELYSYRFVDIKGKFKMGMYQVTFAEYDRYCQVKDVKIKKPKDKEWGRGKRPVIYVSWHEADAYTKWLTEVLDDTYTLPNSDDWYLACNNDKDDPWHFGDNDKVLKEYAWYRENSEGKTHPVGEKKPNDLGLYDMHGNVWEWCEDWYDNDEDTKVLRGGSWINVASNSRASDRLRFLPTDGDDDIGFRLQRTLHS